MLPSFSPTEPSEEAKHTHTHTHTHGEVCIRLPAYLGRTASPVEALQRHVAFYYDVTLSFRLMISLSKELTY